jgi:hypothetical protein
MESARSTAAFSARPGRNKGNYFHTLSISHSNRVSRDTRVRSATEWMSAATGGTASQHRNTILTEWRRAEDRQPRSSSPWQEIQSRGVRRPVVS